MCGTLVLLLGLVLNATPKTLSGLGSFPKRPSIHVALAVLCEGLTVYAVPERLVPIALAVLRDGLANDTTPSWNDSFLLPSPYAAKAWPSMPS